MGFVAHGCVHCDRVFFHSYMLGMTRLRFVLGLEDEEGCVWKQDSSNHIWEDWEIHQMHSCDLKSLWAESLIIQKTVRVCVCVCRRDPALWKDLVWFDEEFNILFLYHPKTWPKQTVNTTESLHSLHNTKNQH